MAIGSTYEKSDYKPHVFKIKSKIVDEKTKKDIPCVPHLFQILEKKGENWEAREKYETEVSGDLKKIICEKKVWEGTEYHVIKITLEDHDLKESYMLDLRANGDFRNLANSILALDPSDVTGLKIKFYSKKSEKDGKEYSNIGLYKDGKFTKGKYAWSEMPEIIKIPFKGKTQSDTTNVDNWVVDKLAEFAKQITPAAKPVSEKSQVVEDHGVPAEMDEDDSNIPF